MLLVLVDRDCYLGLFRDKGCRLRLELGLEGYVRYIHKELVVCYEERVSWQRGLTQFSVSSQLT